MKIQKAFPAFGTINTISINCPAKQEVIVKVTLEKIKQKIFELNHLWTIFEEDSEMSEIQKLSGIKPVSLTEDTFALLQEAVTCAKETNGAFDPTICPVSEIWKQAVKHEKLPDPASIQKKLLLVNYKQIQLDEKEQSCFLPLKGQKLDLGGIAKGYAADRAREELLNIGIQEAVINFGGTLYFIGEPKQAGIKNPLTGENQLIGTLSIKDQAVVTSGIYENYIQIKDKLYHHILDPKTGFPAENQLGCVTLIGDHAARLDAFATAVLILGPVQGAQLIQKYHIKGIFVTRNGAVFTTSDLTDFTLSKTCIRQV